MAPSGTPDWWKTSVVYQVLPPTFKDSNDDGIGDIGGIISKLDYIQSLGVDTVWVSPMYDSGQVDLGYDVKNYCDVYRPYGTVADMERLIKEAHDRDMRIMLDLVISHTSKEHPWFQESRSSKTSPKRDWYYWRPAKYDDQGSRLPPNNWKSVFGEGSAWSWDDTTKEYYLHLFTPAQPDLNWENAEVRKAVIEEAIVFWLDKGVDAFRLDAANMYSKPEGLPDGEVTLQDWPFQPVNAMICNGPKIHEYLAEIQDVFRQHGAVSAGELAFTSGRDEILPYIGGEDRQMDIAFQFDIVGVGMGLPRKYDITPRDWTLPALKTAVEQVQDTIKGMGAGTAIFMESHDQGRSISRFGNDKPEHRVASGKLLAMLQTTLSGTLFLYQGQEIGCVNVPDDFPIEAMADPEAGLYYEFVKKHGDADGVARAAAAVRHLGRFNARMPMAWDGNAPHAGFSGAEPRTRLHPLSGEISVAQQEGDGDSVLAFWRRMVRLRRDYASVFMHGEFVAVDGEHESLFVYVKKGEQGDALVVLNFAAEENAGWMKSLEGSFDLGVECDLLASSLGGDVILETLRPLEARVYFVGRKEE
jgi:oligo-1,6-glucosidase